MADEDCISRAGALTLGLARYFTGKPCLNGHIAERYTSSSTCTECHRARTNARYPISKAKTGEWKRANRDRVNRLARVSYTNNKDARRERSRKHNKKFRLKHKGYMAAASKRWREENHDQHMAIIRNRKAKLHGADGKHTHNDISRIFRAQRGKCAMPSCRIELKDQYHVDHIMPISKGGTHWPRNIQLLCKSCNLSKSNKNPIDYVQELGFLI